MPVSTKMSRLIRTAFSKAFVHGRAVHPDVCLVIVFCEDEGCEGGEGGEGGEELHCYVLAKVGGSKDMNCCVCGGWRGRVGELYASMRESWEIWGSLLLGTWSMWGQIHVVLRERAVLVDMVAACRGFCVE